MVPTLLLLGFASAHTCLIVPHQRGELSLKSPGDRTCYRRIPECGNLPPETPKVTYHAGGRATFTFQQNLNHWSIAKPGFFDLAISYDVKETKWVTITKVNDFPANDMVTSTNFTLSVTLPHTTSDHAVLRVRYVSHNPLEVDPANNTDAIFYNCADIKIVSAPVGMELEKQEGLVGSSSSDVVAVSSAAADVHCVAPRKWHGTATTVTHGGEHKVAHEIWYDSDTKLVRWDKKGAIMNDTYDEMSMISNYTDYSRGEPPEFVFYPKQNICRIYGANDFYAWQYGAQNGMTFAKNGTQGGREYIQWTNPSGMSWEAESKTCLPISFTHWGHITTFTAHAVDRFDPTLFRINPACNQAVMMKCSTL